MKTSDVFVRFKFASMEEAFEKAEAMKNWNDEVLIIQSYDNFDCYDNFNKPLQKVVFYVENEHGMIRNFEKIEHHWINGKMRF